MNVKIRKARLKDIPAIVNLWKELMKEHDRIVLKENPKLKPHIAKKKDALNIQRKYIQKNIRSKNGMVYVAEVEGKPIGYCLVFIEKNIPIFKPEKIGIMGSFFVKKEFRRMKIASKFRNEAIKWFKKKGIKCISLRVYRGNKYAYSVYNKWGFFDYWTEMRREI